MYVFFSFVKDTSCGSFGEPGDVLKLHFFADRQHQLPPVENIGDFLYLHNVQITEWQGKVLPITRLFSGFFISLLFFFLIFCYFLMQGGNSKCLYGTARMPRQTTWFHLQNGVGPSSTSDNILLLNRKFYEVQELSKRLLAWKRCSEQLTENDSSEGRYSETDSSEGR